MTNDELTKYWNNSFPNFPPIAYELKNKFNERWLRIHTLPESKRYADSQSEFNEIFKRHNLVLSDLLGEKDAYFLLTVGYSSNINKPLKDKKLQALNLQTNYWLSINVSGEEKHPFYWHVFYDEKVWSEYSVNDLLRLVANDEVGNVMFYSVEKHILYHPYDGGADIIFENSELRDLFKEKYKDWLSNHPLGL